MYVSITYLSIYLGGFTKSGHPLLIFQDNPQFEQVIGLSVIMSAGQPVNWATGQRINRSTSCSSTISRRMTVTCCCYSSLQVLNLGEGQLPVAVAQAIYLRAG